MDIFHQICRSCNNERKNMLNIFESTLLAKSIRVEDMISCCIQEPVTIVDKYPKQICYLCAKQLEITYKFLLQYNKSKQQFDQIIEYMDKCEPDDAQNDSQNEPDMLGLTYQCAFENQQQQILTDNSDADNTSYQALNRTSVNSYTENQTNFNNVDHSLDIQENAINQNSFNSPDHSLFRNVLSKKTPTHKKIETKGIATKIPCSYCTKSFFTVKALILHQKISHKLKVKSECLQNLCGKCGEAFGSNSSLDEHTKECFAEIPVYNCSICSKAFISKGKLEQHMRLCLE